MQAFRTSNLALVLCALLCAALATPARALLVDFEDSVPAVSTTTASSQGFKFTGSVIFSVGPSVPNHCVNGTRLICDQFGGAANAVTMTQISGGPFDLLGLDLQEGINVASAAAQVIRVTGFFGLGGSISADFDLDDNWTTFETFATPGFSALSSATIAPLGGRQFMGLDNAQVTPVPEPASVALVGVALAGLASVRRRVARR